MAKDHINLNVAHLSQTLNLQDAEAVHSVGASHLGEYFEIMFGEEIPQDDHLGRLANRVLGTLAVLSTDERLVESVELDPLAFIPHWLGAMDPFVGATKTLGKHVDGSLTAAERTGNREVVSNDVTYGVGLFDVASFAVAIQLELPHPRYRVNGLMDRARAVTPNDHTLVDKPEPGQLTAFELLLVLPSIKAEYRKRMLQLRVQGQRIIEKAESNLSRLQRILNLRGL